MPKSAKISLLATSVVLVLCVFFGMTARGVSAASGGQAGQDGAYRQINVFNEVLNHVQNDYVEAPSIPNVTNGALRGLLESLDGESSYMTAAEYKAYKSEAADKNAKAQIGVHVSKRFGYATVISVVPGSPADKADIAAGDTIETIGTQDTHDISLATIQTLLQGAPGTEVQLAVIRPRKADPEKVTVSRAVVVDPPVEESMYEGSSILYLKPETLDAVHVGQIEAKLKAMNKSGNKKILLDLRDVSTGDMTEAMRAANLFVGSGTIATLQGQTFPKQTFTAEAGKAVNTAAPLVVLVNRGTSGPAELVAAAILDNKRGELVGEKTFGEGSLQKTFDLADGGAVILSIAKYASPSGKKFEDDAVTPGTLVAMSADSMIPEDDAAGAGVKKPAAKKPTVTVDDQLTKALDMLKAKAA